MKKNIIFAINLILMSAAFMCGCTPEASNISQAKELDGDISVFAQETEIPTYYYLPVGTYDSADTAILENVDTENKTVTLYNTYAGKTYTLRYDGTTYVSDKYGTTMSMAQLNEGTIVNVNFLKSSKLLVDIQVSPEAWTYDNVTRYDLGGINSTATVGDRTYALPKGVRVFSQGENADVMSIVGGDTISVSGIGYDIYSIRVETGHGYVRLSNEDSLVGGWIEIGNSVITQVSKDMLLPVPEGSYTVKMYNAYSSVTQDILVERNQEVVLDCSDITAPEDIYGRILFHVTPDNAKLFLDGEEQNISSVVKASYGVHQIEVSATGYDTLSKYINVGTELADITVRLDETRELTASGNSQTSSEITINNPSTSSNSSNSTSANSKSASSNTVSGNSTVSTNKNANRVYIYYPEDVEVYVDGVYQGLTPMSFKKVAGSHTIILKKSGFVTKSYTIYLYNDGDDINISFSALEAENTSVQNSSSTASDASANTSSSSSPSNSSQSSSSSSSTDSNTSGTTDSNSSNTSDNNEATNSSDTDKKADEEESKASNSDEQTSNDDSNSQSNNNDNEENKNNPSDSDTDISSEGEGSNNT